VADKKLPTQCPSCGSTLRVERLRCPECRSSVEGEFALGLLARLDADEGQLVISLIKASGSLMDLASEYGVSYPTIRNRVDGLIDRVKQLEKELARQQKEGSHGRS
jgi:hypothetical protein